MLNSFDSLNSITSEEQELANKKLREYFDEMELPKDEIEKRISLATDIEEVFRNLFLIMLGYQVLNEDLSAKRQEFSDYAYHGYVNAMIDNGFSNDENYQAYGYIEQYAKNRCNEIVDTAILKRVDSYYKGISMSDFGGVESNDVFSIGHSIAIACDESNAVANYAREQRAIAQGYTMKTWNTMRDNKVRHSHELVDGKTISIFKPFQVGDSKMMFPMDESLGASKREIFGCRCVAEYSGKGNKK